ncbi:kinase-like protein [Clavulina sp. PMI_390]|nr:kinase-like protein [Clavulina sp. PMI_390]
MCLLLGASRGVMYLHSQNPPVVHGRLHPGNILIDNSGRPLLCDFGFDRMSHRVTLAPTLPRNGDKIRFLDPEAHTSLGFTSSLGQESDIFGLAMIFLNVWSGQLPFSEIKDERKVELRYILGRRPAKPVIAVDLRPEIRDTFWELLVAMWTHDMAMRPRIGHVLEQLERIFDGSPDITALFTSFPVLSCDLTACRPPVASKSSILRPHLHTQSTSTSGRELSKFTSTAPASTSSHILPRTPHSHEYDVIVMVSSWDLSIWIPVNIGSPLTGKSIRKLIYTAVDIHDDHCRLTSLRRVYASSGRTSDALSDYALLEICLNMGDSEGTLEFHVSREIPSTFLENPVSLEDKTARNAAPRPAPLPVRKAGDQGEGDGPKTYHSTDALLRTAFPLGSPTAMTISICQIGSPKLVSFDERFAENNTDPSIVVRS